MNRDQVAEIQGLYGPFTLSERVIQKIWLRQDFDTSELMTASGKSLTVKDPGRWNLQEGPDFKEAQLILDGTERVGDVEVHFNASDWSGHQHEQDANYSHVVLHVVLYLERSGQFHPVQTREGHTPELIHLMPLLKQDLESYAMDDALLELEQQDTLEWVARFIEQPFEKRVEILKQRALARWQQKLKYAQQRLEAEGWEAACHQYALEVLGYKRNRAPMLRLAARYPLAQMRDKGDERRTLNTERRILNAEGLFDQEAAHWKLNGLRPANHPRRRLAQYLEVVAKQPHWPVRLEACLRAFPKVEVEGETAAFRKAVGLTKLRATIGESVFSSLIGEKRLNTLVTDAMLPLAKAAGLLEGYRYWLHWFPGDRPDALQVFLKQAGIINRQNPQNNGWNQGALGLFLDQHT